MSSFGPGGELATSFFPPVPVGLRGRELELSTLGALVLEGATSRFALVGSGGSGKSMLVAALGHRLAPSFPGGVHWFRVGAWDFYTLTEMLALRFGLPVGDERVPLLQEFFRTGARRLIVLDNHEDDRAMARLLDTFRELSVTFLITARRCLLAGVFVYPVVAPLVASAESAFPEVRSLTRLLRFNPLALDVADAMVKSGAVTVGELETWLRGEGVERVVAIEHEDDLPEVALLVAWAFPRLSEGSRRMLAVLAHVDGDHVDRRSLAQLADVRRGAESALRALLLWHLVQEPAPGRFALHAVVRHAVRRRTSYPLARFYEHYVALLEAEPERLLHEQSHLFAAMDHAHRTSDLSAMLRVQALLRKLAP